MNLEGLKTILVAHDFSDEAAGALERAASLPLAPQASLVLLHCLEEGGRPPDEAHRHLEQEASRARAELASKGCQVRAVVVEGEPAEQITSMAEETGADLIIMGRGRRHGLRDVLLGSTAERVIQKAPCPVLLTHAHGPRHYRRIIVAWDLEERAREGLALVPLLTREEQAMVEVLHVYETPYSLVLHAEGAPTERELEYIAECREKAARIVAAQLRSAPSVGEDRQVRLTSGEPGRAILEEADRAQADLIILGNPPRPRLARMLAPGVTDSVARRASRDVLVAAPEAHSPEA